MHGSRALALLAVVFLVAPLAGCSIGTPPGYLDIILVKKTSSREYYSKIESSIVFAQARTGDGEIKSWFFLDSPIPVEFVALEDDPDGIVVVSGKMNASRFDRVGVTLNPINATDEDGNATGINTQNRFLFVEFPFEVQPKKRTVVTLDVWVNRLSDGRLFLEGNPAGTSYLVTGTGS